jgi:DNA polymerase-4
MDAFFASVEVARKPVLAGKPVIVGGGERGVVLAATYEARPFGVRAGMPIARARVLAPQALFIPPDHREYYRISTGVMDILHSITPEVEQVSVDEAFLDIRGSKRRLGSALEIGAMLRERIYDEFSLTCSVGIARNKFVAKLASTNCKPNGLMIVPAARTTEFVQCLPVGSLWGVGVKTQERLAEWGITQVAELAVMEVSALARIVGPAAAAHLHALAWGRDDRPVVTERNEKSIGAETTFSKDLVDLDQLLNHFWALADQCGSRLRRKQLVGRTIAIKVRNTHFETVTRSMRLDSPTNSSKAIYEAARELFAGLKRPSATRLVGIRVENLENESDSVFQDTLADSVVGAGVALSRSERVMDQIRAKFGESAIERAAQGGLRLSRPQ